MVAWTLRKSLGTLVGVGWLVATTFGLARLWTYEATAGVPANAPKTFPAPQPAERPTLVLLIHPRCPCTRATIDELAKLMTDCQGKLDATVFVIRPKGMPDGWERSELWTRAASIPGVTVSSDDQGTAARRFGSATSGQALLYSAGGELLFAGGITESRGHGGDNAGRAAITDLVLGTSPRVAHQTNSPLSAPVYGCPLFDATSIAAHEGEGMVTCRK